MTEQEIADLVARNQQLEADLARVTQNRDSILREKKALEHRRADDETDRVLRLADRYLKGQVNFGTDGYATDRVTITRAEARDPQAYQKAKATAEQRKVPLVIVDGDADPALVNNARGAPSTVKFVEDERTFWAHQAMQRQVGIIELNRRAAAAGKTLRIFKSAEDLDPEARAKHDRILEEGDPDALLFEGA
jgi:hypothetical protein